MNQNSNLLDIVNQIDPSQLDYQEWINVGFALKHERFTAADWDNWSRRDTNRYVAGECFRKWDGFNGTAKPVTAATIVQMAKDFGWQPERKDIEGFELEWDAVIGSHKDDLVVVNKAWLEDKEVNEPTEWKPVEQLVRYLETLFEASENVGYVTQSWEKDGRYLPNKGLYDRTAGELIQLLNQCNGDIGSVIGDCNAEAGAWIRFNPLDGKGVKNENVTDYRYALVESDVIDIDRQNAIIRELELPVACLVHSGKKSLHAIVRIDADTYDEYRKRVDYLYAVCQKNGLKIDSQNRNPSRLSRMPGIMRSGRKQFLVDTNIGKENWRVWQEWIEGVNDDLPDPESMADVWDNLPPLAPPLINNVLRQGHKMLLAGPSKAGKSYALIELYCAIAEGKTWLEWQCAKGRVMYVNLELDRASCLHRFKDVYEALGWTHGNIANIDIWNLRGKSAPMDKLAPKLIRRAMKKNYLAIIIDPIYKVITGDENSADQMARFCNEFDRVCTELGAAVIYCHHHSKGTQGQKRSMDRASGSGVFARDPDVLLDLIELECSDKIITKLSSDAICEVCSKWMDKTQPGWDDSVNTHDQNSEKFMLDLCREKFRKKDTKEAFEGEVFAARELIRTRSAWRIDGTLREFPKFEPINLWFEYPIHRVDHGEILKDVEPEGEKAPWQKALEKRKPKEVKAEDRKESIEMAFEACRFCGPVTVQSLAEYAGVSVKSIRRRVKEHGEFEITDGQVLRTKT